MAIGSFHAARTEPPWVLAGMSLARGKLRVRSALLVLLGTSLGALFTAFLFLATSVPSACKQHFGINFSTIERLQQWSDPNFAKKRLSVYVYELAAEFNDELVDRSHRSPPSIRDPFCDSNFYSSEMHVHKFLLHSAVRTLDPEEADFFYVPIYATCNLIVHQPNDMARNGAHFTKGMNIIIEKYPYWNRTNGRDHVFVFAQGFGARLSGNWQRYRNAIFLVHNGEITAPEYTPHKDVTIPPQLRHYLLPVWLESEAVTPRVAKQYLAQFGGQVC